jgi:apolipoprotein N-acyltransferase
LLRGTAAVLLTAVLVWFGTGLQPWWPLPWLAAVPVLLFAPGARGWQAAVTAFLAWLLGSFNVWNYYQSALEIPSVVVALMLMAQPLVFTLDVLLFRYLVRRGAPFRALTAFPALWVCFEHMQAVTSAHGTAGSLAYTQLEFLPVLQLASVTGYLGLSFVVMLVAAAIALVIHLRLQAGSQALRIAAVTATVLAALFSFGIARLRQVDSIATVRVGLAASDAPGHLGVASAGAPTIALLEDYFPTIRKLAVDGAKFIVLPEKLGVVTEHTRAESDSLLRTLADESGAQIVVGVVGGTSRVERNEARIYSPRNQPESYYKQHLLPAFEGRFAPGNAISTLKTPVGAAGVAICKDLDFARPSRGYGEAGAGLLLVPAWDFTVDRWSHGHMAVMRGVEYGFSVARSAKQGLLTISDNRGRIIAEKASDAAPMTSLLADVPARSSRTFFQYAGDWLAIVSAALLIWALTAAIRTPKSS